MTTNVGTMASISPPLERYRRAERTLWERFGLEPKEHVIDLVDPHVRLRVVEVGSGDPVIFIPGTGGTGPYWAPLVKELSGFRCLLLDRPGWGMSEPIDYRGRPFGDLTAAILVGVMDHLGIDQAYPVGASVGNIWALALAARQPTAVRRLVLVGGSPWREVPIPSFFRLLASPLGALIVRMPLSANATASQVRAIGHADSLADGRMAGFIDWRVSLTRETASMQHERDMVTAYIGRRTWRAGFVPTDEELSLVRQPVRMVFGSDDTAGSPEVWRRFVRLLPRGELDLVEHAGHMAWWDEPERVGLSIRSFLTADPSPVRRS